MIALPRRGDRRPVPLPDPWTVVALALAAAVALPVLVVASHVFVPTEGVWSHLASTVLATYVVNTLWLAFGVGLGAVAIGVGAAWLVTMCRFPGRGLFEWAMILPLAVPAYVMAYAYTDLLQFAGPVQTTLREVTGWGPRDYWFPPIRSLGGAIAMLTLVLYPYVYLLARAALLEQSGCALEIARTLGYGPLGCLRHVLLPLVRPAVVAGLALVLMETLADFGTVSYFAVPTFTTGIYRAWFSLGSHAAAAQLSTLLLGFVLLAVLLERRSRGRARYHHTSDRLRPIGRYELRGARAGLAVIACALPLTLGFLLPGAVLLHMALVAGDAQFGPRFVRLAFNSLTLAAVTAMLAVLLALALGYAARLRPTRLVRTANRIAAGGYAVPGAVIAVGTLIPFAAFDNALDAWMRTTFGVSTGLLLTGSIAGLVFAYLVRFLAVSLHTVEAGLTKIGPHLDDVARCLGSRPGGVLLRVHAPLMWSSLFTAGLLVFVDVMKELPATLILRPFNFDTLAVQAHNLAADERLTEASTAALMIVAAGLLPVILLCRTISRARPERDVPPL
ncbi:MAG TPA: iron ABC transporter permease [Geminicoccaceae bacterium]|nr:iron ABC transporter permease [Geminicoccaceae bacterium]